MDEEEVWCVVGTVFGSLVKIWEETTGACLNYWFRTGKKETPKRKYSDQVAVERTTKGQRSECKNSGGEVWSADSVKGCYVQTSADGTRHPGITGVGLQVRGIDPGARPRVGGED